MNFYYLHLFAFNRAEVGHPLYFAWCCCFRPSAFVLEASRDYEALIPSEGRLERLVPVWWETRPQLNSPLTTHSSSRKSWEMESHLGPLVSNSVFKPLPLIRALFMPADGYHHRCSLSLLQSQGTCLAVNSSFVKAYCRHTLSSILPTAHGGSLDSVHGICSSGGKFHRQIHEMTQRERIESSPSMDDILFHSCQGSILRLFHSQEHTSDSSDQSKQ